MSRELTYAALFALLVLGLLAMLALTVMAASTVSAAPVPPVKQAKVPPLFVAGTYDTAWGAYRGTETYGVGGSYSWNGDSGPWVGIWEVKDGSLQVTARQLGAAVEIPPLIWAIHLPPGRQLAAILAGTTQEGVEVEMQLSGFEGRLGA